LIQSILHKLKHPLAGGDLDSPAVTLQRAKIIRSKPFLFKIYCRWYRLLAAALPTAAGGPVLELGSGAGFLKDFIPGLITSELLDTRQVDLALDGCRLPFKDGCLRAVVMVDVFHHLPDAGRFLTESARCVQPGGAVVMIEPWMTSFSLPVYRYLHHEPVDLATSDWRLPAGGPLSNANAALPWVVFQRDVQKFKAAFPDWQMKALCLHTPFSYLLSGGVSFKSFAPGRLFKLCSRIEKALTPFMPRLAMFATILLERRGH
jgi:SAM-dependent methyltransferase